MALTDNLIAYYKLDWNSTDSLWTYNGTDTSITYVSWKIWSWASGNGTSSFISAWTPIDGWVFSVSFWLKMNVEIASWQCHFFSQRNNTSKTGYFISYEYNWWTRRVWFARQKPNVSSDIVYSSQTLWTTNWNHYWLTYDWTTVTWYFNWTSIGTVASTGSGSWTFSTWINLLRDIESWTVNANAIIDEVAQYSRALSWSEITQLYNGWAWLTYPFTTTTSNPAFLLNFL